MTRKAASTAAVNADAAEAIADGLANTVEPTPAPVHASKRPSPKARATFAPATTPAPASKPAPAKASKPTTAKVATSKAAKVAKPAAPKFAPGQCHFTGGWGDESNGFRKLVIANVACTEAAAKGKTHCSSHEAMYLAAAKLRASARRAEADKQAGITKAQGSAASVTPKARKAKAGATTPEERIARTAHKSTPPVRPMGSEPIARVKAATPVATA